MIDKNIDWLKIFLLTTMQLHIEDINSAIQNLHNDFEMSTQINNSRINKTEGKIIDTNCSVSFIEEKYRIDN